MIALCEATLSTGNFTRSSLRSAYAVLKYRGPKAAGLLEHILLRHKVRSHLLVLQLLRVELVLRVDEGPLEGERLRADWFLCVSVLHEFELLLLNRIRTHMRTLLNQRLLARYEGTHSISLHEHGVLYGRGACLRDRLVSFGLLQNFKYALEVFAEKPWVRPLG